MRLISRLLAGFAVALISASSAVAQQSPPPTGPAPGTSDEVTIGDLAFKVTSVRVTAPTNIAIYATATISMQVRSLSATPIILVYKTGTISLTDEHGYLYKDGNGTPSQITGVGAANERQVNLDYVIDPGQTMGIQIRISRVGAVGQTAGTNYDLAAEFAAYQNIGEGKAKSVRVYPLSIVGLQRTPLIQGAIEGVGDQVKQGFGAFFHH